MANDVALTGTAKVGLGAWPFLWNVNLTPMLFSGKMQMLAAYRTNNTGNDLTLFTKMLTVEDLQSDRPAKLGEELGIKQAATPLFSTNRYLDDKLNFSSAWDKTFGIDINNGTPVHQTLETPALSVDNDLRLIFPIGERLLDFTSFIGYGQTPHRLEVVPGVFADLLNDSVAYPKTVQKLNTRQYFADHAVSAIFTVGRFTIRPKAGFLFVEREINSQLCDDETQVRRRQLKPYLDASVEYKRNRFSVGMELPLSLQSVMVQSENDGDRMTKLLFNPNLWSRFKLGDFWTLNASVRMSHRIENYDTWLDGYLLTDYQDLVMRKAPLSLSRTLSGSVGAQFKEPFISLNADLRYGIGHTHSENLYRYEIGEGGLSTLEVIALPNNRFYQILSGSVKKYFSPIRTSIGLKGNLLDSHGVVWVNGALIITQNLSFSLSPSVLFKATQWLNVDYSLNYNRLFSFIDGQKRGDITYWRHFGKAFAFLPKNQTISMTAEYYRHQEQPYLFVDAGYEFSIKQPKLDFEVRWNNIFNSKKYVSFYSGAFSMQETVYTLRPMEVMASVRFRF